MKIKLISLNVSIFDANNDGLNSFLVEYVPEIICFQEVTRNVDTSAHDRYISKDAIDKATPQLSHAFYAPNAAFKEVAIPNFHGKKLFTHDFGGVIEYGNYVKSRTKIIEGKSVFVQNSFSYSYDGDWFSQHMGNEPRMVQIVDIEINHRPHRIINYHGIWSKDKQDSEKTRNVSKQIAQFAQEVDYPTIICGDFNLFPDTKSMQILADRYISLVDRYNIQSTRPSSNELNGTKRNVVDFVFVDKRIKVVSFSVPNVDVSDHFPLIMEFEVAGK